MTTLVIQAGHVAPREPGFESGTGTTREAEFAAEVQGRLAYLLEKDGRWNVVLCGGKTPSPRPFKCDVFLSLHGDGSANTSASGYCYGYPLTPESRAFAGLLYREYEKLLGHPPHRKDNYTRNLSGYYGFSSRRIDAPVKVLVEHGFLTNPSERDWLFANVGKIAGAHYRAICRQFNRRAIALHAKPKVRVDVYADNRKVNTAQDIQNPKFRARLFDLLRRFKNVRVVRRETT